MNARNLILSLPLLILASSAFAAPAVVGSWSKCLVNDGGHGPRGVEYVMTFGNGTRGYETEILYSGPGCLGDEESRSKKEFSYSSIASGANHEKVEIAFDLDKNSTWQLVRATFEWNFDASESATVELIAGTTLEKGEYKSLSSEAFSQNSMSRVMKKTSSR